MLQKKTYLINKLLQFYAILLSICSTSNLTDRCFINGGIAIDSHRI